MPGRPLEGIRVSDFTWAWAGPYATALLAWMGAEVIKVESMRRLDHARRQRLYGGGFSGTVNQAGPFNDLNLNKLSIRLDLTQPKAVALAKALVQVSDVVAENYRPGVMANLGLDYAALKEVPGVNECHEVMGPYDIVVELVVDSLTDVPPILGNRIRAIPGIESTTSLVTFPD